MKLVSLTVCLFNLSKTKALECLSVIHQKCMPRPKILDVNEGVGEVVICSMTLWQKCAFLMSSRA